MFLWPTSWHLLDCVDNLVQVAIGHKGGLRKFQFSSLVIYKIVGIIAVSTLRCSLPCSQINNISQMSI